MGERQASLCQVGAMREAGRAGIRREISEWPRMRQTQTQREVGKEERGREIRERGILVFAKKIKPIVINFIYRLFIEGTQGVGIVLTRMIRIPNA
jgi:hypothetical protein